MKSINPIKLIGSWTEGYALDYHVLSSEYLGVDAFGKDIFETKRTIMGELLYEFKYHYDFSKLNDIMELVTPFLVEWEISDKIDTILSAPASKRRSMQPVYELSKKIGTYLNKPVGKDVFEKNDLIQAKDFSTEQKEEIAKAIKKVKSAKRVLNILLIDDLFATGKTLEACVKELRKDSNINNIYILTLTKTKG